MAHKTWHNEIQPEEVSIALEHILIAPEGTAWTVGRIDVSSPPGDFIYMGAVQEDTPQLTINKDIYRLMTGVPRVLQYQAVVGVSGELVMTFHSNRGSRVYASLGGLKHYHQATSPWAVVNSVVSRTELLVTSTAGVGGLAVGDLAVTDTSANITGTFNEAFVTSIAAMTGNTLYRVFFANGGGFPVLPVVSNPIYEVAHVRNALGSKVLPFFRILGVGDFLNGSQVIHDFKKATPRGQWVEQLRNAADARVPAIFDLFGYSVDTPYTSTDELIVGERYWFSPNSVGL